MVRYGSQPSARGAAFIAVRGGAALWLALIMATAASAQAPVRLPPIEAPIVHRPVSSLDEKLRSRGDLTLTDTTLRQALFTISEQWEINLVVGEDVAGHVNGVFKNAPLHEILHSILVANGYGYRVVGQGLVVTKLGATSEANPLMTAEAIHVRSIKPEEIIDAIHVLRSPEGKVTAIPAASALMVIDLPERIAVIRSFVRQIDGGAAGDGSLDAPLERRIAQFTPQYVKALSVKESLDAILSKDGKAVTIETENRVIVVDYPDNIKLAEQVMRELDIARPQVRITALIYDVSLEDLEKLGINWNHAVKSNNLTATGDPASTWAIDSLTAVPVSAGTPAATMTFMNLSRNFDITATIDALCRSTDAQLLADPSVTVVDREPATIQIVTEIPFQQLTQTQQGGNIGTTAFREAGVMLKVVPHIALDETVQMEVTPTFSRLTGFTNGANPQPIIDKREAQTTVRVANHQWLVIGGLKQRTAVKDDRAVPKLSSLKVFGKLFQAYDYSFRESELVVFLMPEIVTPQYAGREREQIVLGSATDRMDEVPIAPHVLGQGEVGCPTCGKYGCQGCGKPWRPWGSQPRPYQETEVTLGDRAREPKNLERSAQPAPAVNSEPIRRLPRVETVPTPPPAKPPAAPAQASKPVASRSAIFGGPPVAPAKPKAKSNLWTFGGNDENKKKASAKTPSKATPQVAKAAPKKAEPKKSEPKTGSASWVPSWWK